MRCGSASAAQRYDGVASFGRRPTFDNGAPLLEVFLFDFAGDLYGEALDVAFIGWIRPELNFDSVDDPDPPDGRGLPARPAQLPGARRRTRFRRSASSAPDGVGLFAGRHRLLRNRAMTDKPDAQIRRARLQQTLFLPQTEFPMRAGLPQKEPELLARWAEARPLPAAARGRPRAGRNSSCMTARPTPTATSISGTRSTRSSRTW